MKNLAWKTLQSKYCLHDRWISVRADTCQTADGHIIKDYYVLEYPDYVNILALTKNHDVILVRHYRHGAGKTLLELPSGCLDKNDTSPVAAARRELLEETGYGGGEFIQVGSISPNPANHNNLSHSILATGVSYVTAKQEDANEQVEVVLVPLQQVKQKLFAGEFLQALHVSSMFYALNHLGELHQP